MRYNVAQLLKEPIGSERNYQLDESFTGPQRFADMARGPVHILRTHHGVLVKATLEIGSVLTCGRCLVEFDRTSEILIEDEFFPMVDVQTGRRAAFPVGVEEGSLIDASHVLDLSETVREYFVTDLPMKPLCRLDCLGLCPVCGNNRNLESCDCNGTPMDPRWEALASLMDQPEC